MSLPLAFGKFSNGAQSGWVPFHIVIHHQEELTPLAYRPLAPSDIGETESTLMASVNLNSLEHTPAAVFVGFLVM